MTRIIPRILLWLWGRPLYWDHKDDSSIDVQAKGFGTDNKETFNTLNSVLNSTRLLLHSLLSVGYIFFCSTTMSSLFPQPLKCVWLSKNNFSVEHRQREKRSHNPWAVTQASDQQAVWQSLSQWLPINEQHGKNNNRNISIHMNPYWGPEKYLWCMYNDLRSCKVVAR